MADANTTRYGFVKPEVGASADTWGAKLNTDFDDIDAIAGAITTTGSANAYVLTTGLSLAAYVSGQKFTIKPNFTCSGAATLNVDGLGAKNIYKNAAGTVGAVASGDVVSGVPIDVVYDGTQFVANLSRDAQPIDATLTALAALSWSANSPVVQFTAADTVSLTSSPTLTGITVSQGAAATTPSGTFVNTNDAAAVQVLRLEGDRATPATNDTIYESWYFSDASGNQDEMARVSVIGTTLTNGTEQSRFVWSIMASGSLTQKVGLTGTILFPVTNDGVALGGASNSWADLFLASGGVINWNNGNFTITHSSGLLAFSGAVQARIPLSSETSGTLTSASANKKVACAGNVTLDDGVFTADDFTVFDAGASNRTFTRASGLTMYVNGVDSASATLADNEMGVAHWRSSTVVVLSGAFT